MTHFNLLKVKKKLREIFIEQIIEFELRGPGLPGRTRTPKAG